MLYCVVYELIVLVYALDILYKFLKVLLLLLRCVLSPTISEDTRLYSAVAILNSSNASLYWSVNPPALFTSFDNDAINQALMNQALMNSNISGNVLSPTERLMSNPLGTSTKGVSVNRK